METGNGERRHAKKGRRKWRKADEYRYENFNENLEIACQNLKSSKNKTGCHGRNNCILDFIVRRQYFFLELCGGGKIGINDDKPKRC